MLYWRTLDERVGTNRNVYNRLSFDIKHLLGSLSEYGDVAHVPQQHPNNLISFNAYVFVRGESYALTDREAIIQKGEWQQWRGVSRQNLEICNKLGKGRGK